MFIYIINEKTTLTNSETVNKTVLLLTYPIQTTTR